MKVRIRYNNGKKDEDIEVAYLSLYPRPTLDGSSPALCYMELREPFEGSMVRHLDMNEVDNLWFREA